MQAAAKRFVQANAFNPDSATAMFGDSTYTTLMVLPGSFSHSHLRSFWMGYQLKARSWGVERSSFSPNLSRFTRILCLCLGEKKLIAIAINLR